MKGGVGKFLKSFHYIVAKMRAHQRSGTVESTYVKELSNGVIQKQQVPFMDPNDPSFVFVSRPISIYEHHMEKPITEVSPQMMPSYAKPASSYMAPGAAGGGYGMAPPGGFMPVPPPPAPVGGIYHPPPAYGAPPPTYVSPPPPAYAPPPAAYAPPPAPYPSPPPDHSQIPTDIQQQMFKDQKPNYDYPELK